MALVRNVPPLSQRPGFLRPPSEWVRISALIGSITYAVEALHWAVVFGPLSFEAIQDAVVAAGTLIAARIARRRSVAAATLALLVVWSELMLALARGGRAHPASVLALPVLVSAVGVMFGGRQAIFAGIVTAAALPVAMWTGQALHLHGAPSARFFDEEHWFLTAELAIFVSALIAHVTWKTYKDLFASLEHTRKQYANLFEDAPDGLLALDTQGNILEVNSAARHIFGLEGRPMPELTFDAALERSGAKARIELRNALPGTLLPVELPASDGSVRHLEIAVRSELPPGYLLVVRDVSARRRVEERIGHAQRLQMVGQLAGGIAHDFNNLLTTVGLNAALMQKHEDPVVRAASNDILDAQRRGSVLTRQILAFARRGSRRPQTIDLAEMVKSMSRLLERMLGERHPLELEAEESVLISADRGQVEQIVMNLVTNARDALTSGGPVWVRTRSLSGEEARALGSELSLPRQALLEVEDHGVGISAEVEGHIFEPFFTTKPPGQGTGLGLSTVHGIVAQSGGYISLESTIGRGSVFRVFLPLLEGTAEAVDPASESDGPGGCERILVVDDDANVASIVQRTLEQAGYHVAFAASGEAAQALTAAGLQPDLLLTDVVMPGVDGRELARALRSRLPGVAVLFMSGYFTSPSAENPQSTGPMEEPDTLLRKPFTPGELLARVRRSIDAAKPPDS